MTPEEHYAEAVRLLRIAKQPVLSGAPIGFSTHVEVVQLAQLHAALALYLASFGTDELDWETP